jgi:hypothetical protein
VQEDCLPNSKLELMQEIDNQHFKWIQAQWAQFFGENILDAKSMFYAISQWIGGYLTAVGTHECSRSKHSTAAPATLSPSL